MDTIIELLITAGRFLVGLWPLMFLAVFVGIVKRRKGFGEVARLSIKALMLTWIFFALLNVIFFIFKLDTFSLLPEGTSTKYFFVVGLILLPLAVAVMLDERHKAISAETIEEMRSLSARDFEKLVAETYRAQGHRVEEVGATGDHGIDLVVQTRKGETWLVQCKKYRGKVGEPVIRDFYGALRASNADAGAVITSGSITAQARLWAEGKPIYLYDGEEFLRIIETTKIRRNLPSQLMRTRVERPAAPAPVLQAVAAAATAAAPAAAPVVNHEVDFDSPPAASAGNVIIMPAGTVSSVLDNADEIISESTSHSFFQSTVSAFRPGSPASRIATPAVAVAAPAPVKPNVITYEEAEAYPLPDKRPFMDMNPAPECPACGLPMLLSTKKSMIPFLKSKEIWMCQNAPACDETHVVE